MKKTLLLLFIFATLSAIGQVRPPLEANTVRALTELDARKTIKFRTDSLDKAVMAYVEWNANCFRFKRLAAGSAWSSWICAPDEVTLDANAQDVFEIPSGKLTFKSTGKNMALRVDASNKYEFAGTIILNDDYTAFGKNAAVIGHDTVVYGSDTTYVPVYDNVYKNAILLGHNSRASQDSTAFIGDSTIKQLWIAGSLNTKGILLEGDSAYMKHLVLQEADSGKIAKHMGKTIAWVDDDPDSLYFQGAWYVMGLDSISFADSIQINGQWVKFGESLTFPDSIQVNGEWVHLGGSVTIAIPEAQTLNWNPATGEITILGGNTIDIDGRYLTTETPQNLSWNPETGALGIDGGTGVDLDGRYLVPPTASDGDMMIYGSGSWYATAPIDERVSVIDSEGTKSAPALLYADDFSVTQVGGAVDDWVVSVKPDSLAWDSGTRELSILGSNTVTIEDECACSGATGTFYSKEGRLVTVVNGLVVSIGAPAPLGGIWIMKTNSTSPTYTPVNVTNSGSNLIWTVSGAVSTVYNGNEPTFDFSAAGEKVMTITSTDSLKGVSAVDVLGLITYIEMQDMLLDTLLADQNEINTVKLINNNELVYADFDINSITSLTLTGLDELRVLRLNASGYFGALDLSTFANLEYIDAGDGNLSSITMPASQDVLYYAKLNSEYWDSNDVNYVLNWCNFHGRTDHPDGGQLIMTGSGCGDLDQIENLDVAWYVEVDTCAVVFPEVTIGTQTWMAVNLDIDDGGGGIYAYNNDEANVATYGRLYTWDAAVRIAASIDGWHLPSDAEYKILEMYLGMSEEESNNIGDRGANEGSKLSGGDNLWTSGTMKENANFGDSGFNLIPAGVMFPSFNFFQDIGRSGFLMTSTKNSESPFLPYNRSVSYNKTTVNRDRYYPANPALSVRLIKDTP